LKHGLSRGWKFPTEALHAAVEAGQLQCAEFLREECGMAYTSRTMVIAAKLGCFHMVQYLYENKCRWDAEVCEILAMNDQLHFLKFAHENGCPWDVRTCQAAATCGSLRCLEYAHLQGCRWDDSVAYAAKC